MGASITPVTIDGIEFDAMLEKSINLNSSVPKYPVEDGYSVSDAIINDPLEIEMTLYVSPTPVTFLSKHGVGYSRVTSVVEMLTKKWEEKTPVKIVTQESIYTDMGITSINIKESKDTKRTKEISIKAQKIVITSKETTDIPSSILQSGKTASNGGVATSSEIGETSDAESANGSASSTTGTASDETVKNNGTSTGMAVVDGIKYVVNSFMGRG